MEEEYRKFPLESDEFTTHVKSKRKDRNKWCGGKKNRPHEWVISIPGNTPWFMVKHGCEKGEKKIVTDINGEKIEVVQGAHCIHQVVCKNCGKQLFFNKKAFLCPITKDPHYLPYKRIQLQNGNYRYVRLAKIPDNIEIVALEVLD